MSTTKEKSATSPQVVSSSFASSTTAAMSLDAEKSVSSSGKSPNVGRGSRCCFDGDREAQAWALDAIPRSISMLGAAVFLGTALLQQARLDAGCLEDDDEPCQGRTRQGGIRPSSLLTIYTLSVGVASAVLLPVAGAIVDHTNYRRFLGRWTAFIMTLLTGIQMDLNRHNWLQMAILQVVAGFHWQVHNMVIFAYLPELTSNASKLAQWTAQLSAVGGSSILLFFLVVIGLSVTWDYNEIETARLSSAITLCLMLFFYGAAWSPGMFGSRSASASLSSAEGTSSSSSCSLWTVGFRQLHRTACEIRHTRPSLLWFLLADSLAEAASSSLPILGITYVTELLDFSSSQVGLVVIVLMLASVAGSLAAPRLQQGWCLWGRTENNHLTKSLQGSLFMASITTVFFVATVHSPGHDHWVYLFAVFWGWATGWKYPTERTLYCSLVLEGQEAELMGLFIFSQQALSWLPPLVVTALNEAGWSLRISTASVIFFFILAICLLSLVKQDPNSKEQPLPDVEVEEPNADLFGMDTEDEAEADDGEGPSCSGLPGVDDSRGVLFGSRP